jgi:putative ABC transport system permease protein
MLLLRLIRESLIFAFSSLVMNKLRTFLSLLGITIGIFAIIAVFTVIDSLEYGVRNSIKSLGDDVVYIQKWPWEFSMDYAWWKYMNRPVPTLREYEQLLKKSTKIEEAAFIASTGQKFQVNDKVLENAGIMCASHNYDKIWVLNIEKGRYFNSFESQIGKNLCIVGADIVSELFPTTEPIGQSLKINGFKTEIIGVFEKEGTSIGQSMDRIVLIPINYAKNLYDLKSERMNPFIMARAVPNLKMTDFMDHIKGEMRAIRKLKPMEEDNFALNRASLIAKQFDQIFSVINLAGWMIGGLSILVGAFGIANIMFVTVKERTNQIGIQKALGAKNYFILVQFLTESVVLAMLGGVLGLLFVYTGIQIGNQYIEMDFSLSLANIARGLNISILVGLIAGFVPAYKASHLNPVEAIQSTV